MIRIVTVSLVVALTSPLLAQPPVAIVDLKPTRATPTATLGALAGIKQLSDGRVLVNDGGHRQVRLYDATLRTYSIVADSVAGTRTSYGRQALPFVRWMGDSVVMLDLDAQALVVIAGDGTTRRSVALPSGGRGNMGPFMRAGPALDHQGRLYYRSPPTPVSRPILGADGQPTGGFSVSTQLGDSAAIVRFDMDLRRVDTVGIIQQLAGGVSMVPQTGGGQKTKLTINPLRTVDDWAVLSDGTIAFVRGHDYHVDWILPDGSTRASGKLPFDWKRLTDADKQALIDSARAAENLKWAVNPQNAMRAAASGGDANSGAAASGRSGGRGDDASSSPAQPQPPIIEFVPLSVMADYYPPIRSGSVTADADGNLWVLPTTSAQSKSGELVYDVINPRDGLLLRARVPTGRSVVGFGKGGVVYLAAGSLSAGFALESALLSSAPSVRRQ